jgi:hypothetical protein
LSEDEWPACSDPSILLDVLRQRGLLSERKARLFAAACCRRIWPLIRPEGYRGIVDAAERFADGRAGPGDLRRAEHLAYEEAGMPGRDPARWAATHAAGDCVVLWPWHYPEDTTHFHAANAADQAGGPPDGRPGGEQAAQARLLRDLFGPLPFRPVALDPSLLSWHGGPAVRLATAAYEERKLPGGTLDNARLAVLADALEEAGLEDEEVLGHLREQGIAHYRGCWVLDLVLGKT